MKKWYFTAKLLMYYQGNFQGKREILLSTIIESEHEYFPLEKVKLRINEILIKKDYELEPNTIVDIQVLNQVQVSTDLNTSRFTSILEIVNEVKKRY